MIETMSAAKGLMPKKEVKPGLCEVHIVGDAEFVLKAMGRGSHVGSFS